MIRELEHYFNVFVLQQVNLLFDLIQVGPEHGEHLIHVAGWFTAPTLRNPTLEITYGLELPAYRNRLRVRQTTLLVELIPKQFLLTLGVESKVPECFSLGARQPLGGRHAYLEINSSPVNTCKHRRSRSFDSEGSACR